MKKIKWASVDSYDGTRTSKLHAFKAKLVRDYIRVIGLGKIPDGDSYEGTISLCGLIRPIDENEKRMSLDAMHEEPFIQDQACKICVKLAGQPL